jgi:signal transduction histidine kinase
MQYNNKISELSKKTEEFENNEALYRFKEDITALVNEVRISTENHAVTEDTIKELDRMFPPTITGRNSVDAILSNKINLCETKNIILELNVAPISFDNIIDADLIPLFGNIIDNAIEAAVLSTEKRIELTVISIKNFNVIKISNTKQIDLAPLDNNLNTTKKDSSKHGLGTKIVKMITEKNKGKITYIDNGDEFIVKVILPS